MAQLSDDCFAFGGPMMSVDEAVAAIAAKISAVDEAEIVPLVEADGRVLAATIVAPLPLPPFTNSAVDGYAIRSGDLSLAGRQAFPVVGRIEAGALASVRVAPAQAVRIFTGAPMPENADTVFMQEDVRVEGTDVFLPEGLRAGANVRPTGEDIAVGSDALPKGRRLRPQDVALIAALGLTHATVRRRIRVAVFSTGNELVAPGQPRVTPQLFDSNRFMLMAMLKRLGCEVSDFGILRDDPASLAQSLKRASSGHDLILTSGGVSTGEEDHVKAAVERVGSLVLWRMAIKPGRPVAMGVIQGVPLIGLPGNPVASFVTFTYVVRPTVLALSGTSQTVDLFIPARATFAYKKKIARREYVRSNIIRGGDGMFEVTKFPREGAGLLSSLVETDGFVELPEDTTEVSPGDVVRFLSYASLI
jgi:molybdopterin molybdotransferase